MTLIMLAHTLFMHTMYYASTTLMHDIAQPVVALQQGAAKIPVAPPAAPPTADQTGISSAMTNLAKLGAVAFGGALSFILVIEGFQYVFGDENNRGTHVKRSITTIAVGAIFVLLAVTIAPNVVKAILGQ